MFRTRLSQLIIYKCILFFLLTFPIMSFASNYIPKGYYIIDLKNRVEWLTCSVGATWKNGKCVGKPIKLKLSQVKEAIKLANKQLGGNWRLPSRIELENLVCHQCKDVKINKKYFPKTPYESFWTGEKNNWQPQFNWTVNFFTGHTFGRFPGFIPNYVRLVRDRN